MTQFAKRIGLIVPGDCQIDDEMWELCGPQAIPLITRTRMPVFGSGVPLSTGALAALAESPDIEDAADRLRAVSPDAAAYVDTSITFVRGPGGDTEIAQRVERVLKCPTTVTSTAVAEALQELGARRITAVTPYPDEVNATLPPFMEHYGIHVETVEKLEWNYDSGLTSTEMASIDPAELVGAVAAFPHQQSDAVFISCTAVRTLGAIAPLETSLGKPVVTAIQATMWKVQRLAGLRPELANGGRLFHLQGD